MRSNPNRTDRCQPCPAFQSGLRFLHSLSVAVVSNDEKKVGGDSRKEKRKQCQIVILILIWRKLTSKAAVLSSTVALQLGTRSFLGSLGTTSTIARRKPATVCTLSCNDEEKAAFSNIATFFSLQRRSNGPSSRCFSIPDSSFSCPFHRNDLLGSYFVNGTKLENSQPRIAVILPDKMW